MKLSIDILKNFDFDKILNQLCSACFCEVSREKMIELAPAATASEANQRLQTVQQYFEMMTYDGALDFSGLTDLRGIFQKITIPGSILNISEILKLLDFCILCEKTRHFQNEKKLRGKYPLLADLFNRIENYSPLIKKIKTICSPEGFILDTASDTLFEIRKHLNRLQEEIHITIERCLRSRDLSSMLQETTYTIRRGRYVVPIKSEFRNRIDGVVVDYSSSGSSVFVEPRPILYLNNELEVLTIQEKDEIEIILQKLTADIRPELDRLRTSFDALITLDVLHAQSRLAQKWNAHCPTIGGSVLTIQGGRHPLLGEKAVPFSLHLSPENKIMVISGPNAGGKTVLLKSLALIIYLSYCGVPVPLQPGSTYPFYQHIFVDIGDHQDIEQNLSTFTYRLSAFQSSLPSVSTQSLYLIDEIGTGTDPTEGSALGIGMIEYLSQKGATCIATTHYPLIKNYISQHPGMITASMEFDPTRFQPTYHLLIGEVGESYGIKIAEKIGLPSSIINTAIEQLQTDWLDLNELIISNRQKHQELNALIAEWQEKAADYHTRNQQVRLLQEELENQKKALLKEFREELNQYIKKTRDEVAHLIGQLRKENTLNESIYQQFKKTMDQNLQLAEEITQHTSPIASQLSSPPFQVGEKVMVDLFQKEAEIIAIDDVKNEATIIVNGRKVKITYDHLQKKPFSDASLSSNFSLGYSYRPSTPRVSNEIEIRMLKMEEAREKLDKYFDQALLAGYKTIFIIHGKGEGILRKMTHDYLRENPSVESFRLGLPEEGGLGVTVVTLK